MRGDAYDATLMFPCLPSVYGGNPTQKQVQLSFVNNYFKSVFQQS